MLRLYTAPPELDPFSEKRSRQPIPRSGTFLNAREVLAMAGADASRMPAREAEYHRRAQPARRDRRRRSSPPPFGWLARASRSFSTGEVFSLAWIFPETSDLAALVLAHCDANTGIWHIHPFFWLPGERLLEKAARDHAPL